MTMLAGAVDSIQYVEALDKYVSCSRDGSWRLWNGADLKHFRTMTMGSSWVTDCVYMASVSYTDVQTHTCIRNA